MVAPSHFLPPQRGAGLLQDLARHKQELTPSTPSSLLQGCHGAQGPNPPLVVWFCSCGTNIQSPGEFDHVGVSPQFTLLPPCLYFLSSLYTLIMFWTVTSGLTGHTVMFCFHWLMLELSSSVVQRRCLKSQPQYGSLASKHSLQERGRGGGSEWVNRTWSCIFVKYEEDHSHDCQAPKDHRGVDVIINTSMR